MMHIAVLQWMSRRVTLLTATLIMLGVSTFPLSAQAAPAHHAIGGKDTATTLTADFNLWGVQDITSPVILAYPVTVAISTAGTFVTTLYGQGLQANVYYTLVDNNVNCQDTINHGNTYVKTDLNGRFEFPVLGGGLSGPCTEGAYSITAMKDHHTYSANLTLAPALSKEQALQISPANVVSTTTGSFASAIFASGLDPYTLYVLSDTMNCETSINQSKGGAVILTDAAGNAQYSWVGGPDSFVTSGPCSIGAYSVQLTSLSNAMASPPA